MHYTFEDIFKSSFLEQSASFSLVDTLIALALAFVTGLFIYLIYKKTYAGVMYSAAFGVSLLAMSMITCLVILAVTSNVILSLGMVGALSIVRFRTAVKEPMDIAFMFWAIAAGIVLGAGLWPLAVIGSIIIGVVILLFATRKYKDIPYILVANCTDKVSEASASQMINDMTKKYVLKSKNVTKNGTELTYEIRLNDDNSDIVNGLLELDGVENVVMVSYNGEYMS